MAYFYDPLKRACKSTTGAIPRGGEVTFHIFEEKSGEADFSAQLCSIVIFEDGKHETAIPMKRTADGFAVTLQFHQTGLYFYYFRLDAALLGCGRGRKGELTDHPQCWQITVFREDYTTPQWFKGGVMYQIFPDRFFRAGHNTVKPHQILRGDWGGTPSFRPNEFGKVLNNDFFGGDMQGIREKLGYLKGLHVTALYLNPVFEAYSNHRYDTGDYLKIDPLLGTEADFTALTADAAACGMRVILDGVFNHTGDDSRYFNKYGRYDSVGAYQSTQSPYADWYCFRQFPDSYESWWGIETLPAVNEKSESYQNFICGEHGVVRTWLKRGVSGYRLDVADELPDFFLEKVRAAVKEEKPDALIIGEVWEDASNKISYDVRRKYLQGRELDSVMNYPLKNAIIAFLLTGDCTALRETVAMLIDNYPKETLDCLMNILGTHDTPRILTVLGGKECTDKEEMAVTKLSGEERMRARAKLKMAATLQFTLPGVPCIYYGDESGMEGYRDPFCRRCYDWTHPDEELRAFYEKLGEIRTVRYGDIFRDGEYREIFAAHGCIVFERRKDGEAVVIFANNSATEYTLRAADGFYELLTGQCVEGTFTIGKFSYGILAKLK